MIVQDKESSITLANEISAKIMTLISNELKEFSQCDDPAEQIYLACHIMGGLLAKIYISLEGYGKIYNIPALHKNKLKEWIELICDENLKLNKYE